MNGWQPIETAPKDGTDVLVWRHDSFGRPLPPVVAGWFFNGDEEGWSTYDDSFAWVKGVLTHWQPLPGPPA